MKKLLLLLSMILLLSTSIYAQRNDKANYWNTWEYTAKEDMQKDFEKAAAKKTAMFNKTPETAIMTYRILTGPDSGSYLRVKEINLQQIMIWIELLKENIGMKMLLSMWLKIKVR